MRVRSPRRRHLVAPVLLAAALGASGCGLTTASGSDRSIQVYSARTYGSEQTFARFTEKTGIDVEFLNGSDAELRERLQAEGEDTRADVYLTVDAANLSLAAEQELLQPVDSPLLTEAVPASLRDPESRWFGLTERARAIVYDEDAVDPAQLSTYAALSDPAWKGRLCFRTSTSPYTQSLVASFIAHQGSAGARDVVEGWLANDPQILPNDVEIVRTIAAGGCAVGITNHYYVARELAANPDLGVGVFFPDQATTGTHVNISGAGVTRYSDDVDDARQFLEYLATEGQASLVEGNFEYPVNRSVALLPLVERLGTFRRDELNVGELGRLNAEAVQLLTEVGYR